MQTTPQPVIVIFIVVVIVVVFGVIVIVVVVVVDLLSPKCKRPLTCILEKAITMKKIIIL